MPKHDGWTIKNCMGKSWLCVGYFHELRSEVIKDFEETTELSFEKERRRGNFKLVKVKFTEVA